MPNEIDLRAEFNSRFSTTFVLTACTSAVKKHFPDMSVWRSLPALRDSLAAKGVDLLFRRNERHEGCIEFAPSGAVRIVVRPSPSKSRNRFTVAHEVAHWIIRKEVLPDLIAGSETAYRGIRYTAASKRSEEALANLLAAEILMPRDEVRTLAHDGRDDAHGVIRQITRRFSVSRVAAVRRLSDVLGARIAWIRLIETGAKFGPSCDVDDALFTSPGEATLWARESTWLTDQLDFLPRSDSRTQDVRAAFAGPNGPFRGQFEMRRFGQPAPCLELLGVAQETEAFSVLSSILI